MDLTVDDAEVGLNLEVSELDLGVFHQGVLEVGRSDRIEAVIELWVDMNAKLRRLHRLANGATHDGDKGLGLDAELALQQ